MFFQFQNIKSKAALVICIAFMLISLKNFGQCTSSGGSGEYPAGAYTPASCNGTTSNTILTNGYADGEYSTISVISGNTYTFTSNAGDFLSIRNTAESTLYASGTTPVIWVSTVTGNIRMINHASSGCGTSTSPLRTRTVKCSTVAPVSSGCTSNTTQYPSSAYSISSCNGSNETITSCGYADEYSVINVVSGNTYTFSSSNSSDYLTITNSTGATSYTFNTTPVVWTSTVTGTVRMYNNTNSSCGTNENCRYKYVACSTSGLANDNCSGAIALTVNSSTNCTSTYTATSIGATQSSVACSGTADDDVWFKFTASATTHTVRVTPGTMSDPVLQVFTGNCGSYSNLTCTNVAGASTAEVANLSGLTIGTVYYFRVHSNGNGSGAGTFTTCITTTPASINDTPCDAYSISSSTTCIQTGGTTAGATYSNNAANGGTPGCGSYGSNDVWYTITPTVSTTYTISTTAGTITDGVMELYSSTSCNTGLTSMDCGDDDVGLMPEIIATLTSGSTYYIRFWKYGSSGTGTFSLCVKNATTSAITNDEPTGATPIYTASACSYTTFTNAGSTGSTCGTIPSPGCASYSGGDVWFTATVPASGAIKFDTQADGITDGGMAVYTGTACDVLTLVSCNDDGGTGSMPQISLTGQTPGTRLYIRVWSYGNYESGTFGLCATSASPPANDECTGATSVTVNSGTTCTTQSGGTLVSATSSTNTNSCAGDADDDVWYKFTATAVTHSISINSVAGSPTDLFHSVFVGSCGSLSDAFICSDPNTSIVGGLTIGTTYYIRIYSKASGASTTTFSVCVTTPTMPANPGNDNCNGASTVTVNPSSTCTSLSGGSLVGATSSTIANTCGGTADDDVWYKFTATATSHSISLINTAGSTTDLYHSLYGGTCGSVGPPLVCSDPNTSAVYGLTIGQIYYLRVYSNTSTYGQTSTFSVCVASSPTLGACGNPANNDYCSNPAILTEGGSNFSSSTSSIYSADQSTNLSGIFCGTIENNSWYKFTATKTTHNFPFSAVTPCTWGDGVQAQVFSITSSSVGCCTAFTTKSKCFNPGYQSTGTVSATGLTIGQSYVLMIDGYAGDVCTFTITGWSATGILPIELNSFTGKNIGEQNLIEWTTASEINNDYYSVEKSNDGIYFTKLTDVKGAGNSSNTNYYSTIDDTPFDDITYYRLKYVDYNGGGKYTSVISVDLTNLHENLNNLHPNPTNDNVSFDFYSKTVGNLQIELIDFSGKIVYETQTKISEEKNTQTIEMKNFERGMYLLKVKSEKTGKTYTKKIIKN